MNISQSIEIKTNGYQLDLFVSEEGRLLQKRFATSDEWVEAFPCGGDGWFHEPSLRAVHSDGNTSTDLRVVRVISHDSLTTIEIQDSEYEFFVSLFLKTYPDLDVIETWTEIRHQEPGPVTLTEFYSSSLDFGKSDFFLTQFHGDWADEVNMVEEKLSYGIKNLDSKLGVRAHQFRSPWFLLSRGGPAQEDRGEVFGGSLAWSGSFSFKFEVDQKGGLRTLCGINPYASEYNLSPGEVFQTPAMVWAWSGSGTGQLSRNLHQWVRANVLRDPDEPRAILLNNWEATYFTFDEEKIVSLIKGAKAAGLELFLLDDGWFGVKYPRDHDGQGLGDWTPDPKKLPNGVEALTSAANKENIRFGIWLEPEMVNPLSELYELHPDWAIQQPKRPIETQRNQMVLDLTRPETREFVFEMVDSVLTENPGISYVKWDCNRYLTQPGSSYLAPSDQSHLWILYVRNLYEIFNRLTAKHPSVELMMCSGGGGRVDYGAMKYAHEFWPSDMTDPTKRIFIQWGYSFFFPAISVSAHVTDYGSRPIKFCFDVAMSGRLGMDMDLDKLSEPDLQFSKAAISTYKGIREVVQFGNQYRLESPYDGPRSALMVILGERAVLFVYSLGEVPASLLVLKGLDPAKNYHFREINLQKGANGIVGADLGNHLLKSGFAIPEMGNMSSHVFEITEFTSAG